nr:hypothetical protein [Methylobacterium sp. L1A1]
MAQIFDIRADALRVSRPGIDVRTAAEKDLLISLGARNAQIVQRGFLPMSAGTETPGNLPATMGLSTWVFIIGFPAQASVPDIWVSPIGTGNVDASRQISAYPPTMRVTFASDHARVEFYGSNGRWSGSGSYAGMSYILFRKRLAS